MKADGPTEPQFAALQQLVRTRTGLILTPSRRQDFEAGIRHAMTRAGIANVEEFGRRLATEQQILDVLIAQITVGETYFFREPELFDWLRRQILPALQRSRPLDAKLRFWSAGCASGEEPYSLAILLEQEGLAEHSVILGTDISQPALARAREASFGAWSMRASPAAALAPYFHQRGDRYVLLERLRQSVQFAYLNLVADTYPSHTTGTVDVDVILCRNVLIYVDQDAAQRIARKLFGALRVGGWLITGPSDPPLWNLAPFEAVVTPAGVLYRRGERSDISTSRITPRVTDHSVAAKSGNDARVVVRSTELPTIAITATGPVAAVEPSFRADGLDSVTPPVPEDSPNGEAWTQRVRALADQGDPHRAEQEAAAAIKAYPLNPELHYLGAIILVGVGRYDEATAALRRVIYLDPSLAAAHFTLATVMQRQGQIVEARRAYRSALALCTGRPKDEIVPLSDGERCDQLAAAVQAHLTLTETTEEAR